METNIETMGLSDLNTLKSIIKQRLLKKESWMNSQRGRDYDEFCRRYLSYNKDENHAKLERVNCRIEEILNLV